MDGTINWSAIEQFLGYGRIDAPVVFVGIEEGLASEEDLRKDLLLRSNFSAVMDLALAHRGIVDGEQICCDSHRRQPTWRVMADLMLHYEGTHFVSAIARAEARKIYRAKRLGRSDGNSLLAELLPYPHRKNSSWLYGDLSRYLTRESYIDDVMPERLALLRAKLRAYPRCAIICYGRANWPQFKLLFDGVEFHARGRYETAVWNGAEVTLTDHFATKYFNTDEQLDDLARVALCAT